MNARSKGLAKTPGAWRGHLSDHGSALARSGAFEDMVTKVTTPMLSRLIALLALCLIPILTGCKDQPAATSPAVETPVTITLDWRPEPEFGGFYAAKIGEEFRKRDLSATLTSAGAGAPTWQLVANGQTDFATTSADLVMLARSQGADVVAVFAVYQTSPQGIMVHHERDFTKVDDVFTNPGTLIAEDNPWLKFMLAKVGKPTVTIIADATGISTFLAQKDCSQQCFVTSEPILAEHQGRAPKTFLIADAGFNPYVTVLITSGKMLRQHPDTVSKVVAATREGWRAYLDDPTAANQAMGALNKDMDAQTFADAAAAQKRLIDNDDTVKNGLGTMTAARWKTLGQQLVDLKIIDTAPAPESCFVNLK